MKVRKKNIQNKKNILNRISEDEINKIQNNILNFCAINPHLRVHSEINNYRLIFASYKFSSCELHRFSDSSTTKSLIERFTEITKYSGRTFQQSGLLQPVIKDSTEYRDLLDSIPPDTSLFHIDVGKTARLFYYTVANFFCIVAVTLNHR
jgi:hypothetical protein